MHETARGALCSSRTTTSTLKQLSTHCPSSDLPAASPRPSRPHATRRPSRAWPPRSAARASLVSRMLKSCSASLRLRVMCISTKNWRRCTSCTCEPTSSSASSCDRERRVARRRAGAGSERRSKKSRDSTLGASFRERAARDRARSAWRGQLRRRARTGRRAHEDGEDDAEGHPVDKVVALRDDDGGAEARDEDQQLRRHAQCEAQRARALAHTRRGRVASLTLRVASDLTGCALKTRASQGPRSAVAAELGRIWASTLLGKRRCPNGIEDVRGL
eukprot:6210561-Pleurochrysis_carterae.AAC.2